MKKEIVKANTDWIEVGPYNTCPFEHMFGCSAKSSLKLDFSKYEDDVTVNIYFSDDDYQVTVGDLYKLLKETEK